MMNRFVPQPGPPRGAGDNPYSDYKPPVEAGNRDEEKLMEHRPTQTTESLTPAERAELANFERSRALLNSIIPKSTDQIVATHRDYEMPMDPTSNAPHQDPDWLAKHLQPDEIPELRNNTFSIHHPRYQTLNVDISDLRFAGNPHRQPNEYNDDPTVAVSLDGQLARLYVELLQNGRVRIHFSDEQQRAIMPTTDHSEKMAKLDELYDVLSFVQSDLPDKPKEPDALSTENEVE